MKEPCLVMFGIDVRVFELELFLGGIMFFCKKRFKDKQVIVFLAEVWIGWVMFCFCWVEVRVVVSSRGTRKRGVRPRYTYVSHLK